MKQQEPKPQYPRQGAGFYNFEHDKPVDVNAYYKGPYEPVKHGPAALKFSSSPTNPGRKYWATPTPDGETEYNWTFMKWAEPPGKSRSEQERVLKTVPSHTLVCYLTHDSMDQSKLVWMTNLPGKGPAYICDYGPCPPGLKTPSMESL